jgi:hypothetical protein
MLVAVEVLRLANQEVAEVRVAEDQEQIVAPELQVEQTPAEVAVEIVAQVVQVL